MSAISFSMKRNNNYVVERPDIVSVPCKTLSKCWFQEFGSVMKLRLEVNIRLDEVKMSRLEKPPISL